MPFVSILKRGRTACSRIEISTATPHIPMPVSDEMPGTEPEHEESAQTEPVDHAEEALPVSEVARRLSLLGRLIVPPAPY
jgi:hypothetical protein